MERYSHSLQQRIQNKSSIFNTTSPPIFSVRLENNAILFYKWQSIAHLLYSTVKRWWFPSFLFWFCQFGFQFSWFNFKHKTVYLPISRTVTNTVWQSTHCVQMTYQIQIKCVTFAITSIPIAQQSMCNSVFKVWEQFLSQMHAVVWWNGATAVSEKHTTRTHYLFIWSKENLKEATNQHCG